MSAKQPLLVLFLLSLSVAPSSECRAVPPTPIFDEVIDAPMYRLPELPKAPVVYVQHIDLRLWLHALEQPEAETKCKVAESLVLAHERHVQGLDTTIEPLLKALNQPDQHPTVILAVARALIALDVRKSADSLFRHAQAGGHDLRVAIEPALARWNYEPAYAMWLDRLREPTTPGGSLLLAINGLADVKNPDAVLPLRKIVFDASRPSQHRLASARALGGLCDAGLEEDAARLTSETARMELIARLAGASLLQRHSSEQAVQILQKLLRDSEPAVAVLAAQRLLALDPKYLLADLETHILKSPDASLRLLGVKALHRQPKQKHLKLLATHLDDRDMLVRVQARKAMLDLAKDKQSRTQIIEDATRVLAADSWRGLVQSAILLSQLDHKPAAARLVKLLTNKREEVQIAAAWGLRKLNVAATLPEVVRFIEKEPSKHPPAKGRPGAPPPGPPPTAVGVIDHVLAQLNQLVGQQNYKPADPILRRYVRKHYMGNEARAGAVWALGMIHERDTKKDDTLIDTLAERLADSDSIPPEDMRVRWMCAIALGRMKAKKAEDTLRFSYPSKRADADPVNNACGWALEQLTGEKMAPPLPVRKVQRDWFLVPNTKAK